MIHRPVPNRLRTAEHEDLHKNNEPKIGFLKADDIEENGYPKTQRNYQKYNMSYGLNPCYLMILSYYGPQNYLSTQSQGQIVTGRAFLAIFLF